MDERTLVYMSDNPKHVVESYVDSGEGLDCAGGFNIAVGIVQTLLLVIGFDKIKLTSCEQGNGALLMSKIDGDYHNVAGFPAPSFFKLLDLLLDEEEDFLGI